MIRRPRLSVLLRVAIIAGVGVGLNPVAAEPPPETRATAAGAPATHMPEGLLQQSGLARFRLILGRLQLDPARHRKGTKEATRSQPYPLTETLTVSSQSGIASLHYTFRSDRQHAIVDVVDILQVRIVSERKDLRQRLTLEQPPEGPLRIRVESLASSATIDDPPSLLTPSFLTPRSSFLTPRSSFSTAPPPAAPASLSTPSLLHLQSSHPRLFAGHLGELLPYLLSTPTVSELNRAAQRQLLATADREPLPTLGEVEACVERLAAPQRRIRVAAERELLAWGLPVLRHLDRLDAALWDSEQRSRIRRVRWTLQPRRADTPQSLVHWLATDPEYWNLVAADWSHEKRHRGDVVLRRVCGTGLDADVLAAAEPIRVAEAAATRSR